MVAVVGRARRSDGCRPDFMGRRRRNIRRVRNTFRSHNQRTKETLNFKVGEVSLALQTDVLDRIMPSLLPVLLTALVYKLLGNKKWTATKLILLIIIIALVCSFFGILTV